MDDVDRFVPGDLRRQKGISLDLGEHVPGIGRARFLPGGLDDRRVRGSGFYRHRNRFRFRSRRRLRLQLRGKLSGNLIVGRRRVRTQLGVDRAERNVLKFVETKFRRRRGQR